LTWDETHSNEGDSAGSPSGAWKTDSGVYYADIETAFGLSLTYDTNANNKPATGDTITLKASVDPVTASYEVSNTKKTAGVIVTDGASYNESQLDTDVTFTYVKASSNWNSDVEVDGKTSGIATSDIQTKYGLSIDETNATEDDKIVITAHKNAEKSVSVTKIADAEDLVTDKEQTVSITAGFNANVSTAKDEISKLIGTENNSKSCADLKDTDENILYCVIKNDTAENISDYKLCIGAPGEDTAVVTIDKISIETAESLDFCVTFTEDEYGEEVKSGYVENIEHSNIPAKYLKAGEYTFKLVKNKSGDETDDTLIDSKSVTLGSVKLLDSTGQEYKTLYGELEDKVDLPTTESDPTLKDESKTFLGWAYTDEENDTTTIYSNADSENVLTFESTPKVLTATYETVTVKELKNNASYDTGAITSADNIATAEKIVDAVKNTEIKSASSGTSSNEGDSETTGNVISNAAKTVLERSEVASAVKNAKSTLGDFDDIRVVLEPVINIKVTDIGSSKTSFTVDITPQCNVIVTKAAVDATTYTTDSDSPDSVILSLSDADTEIEITKPVTIELPIPADLPVTADESGTVWVKHIKDTNNYKYPGTLKDSVLTFTNLHGFSEFEIGVDAPVVTIDGVGFDTLADAVKAAQDGDTVTISDINEVKDTSVKVANSISFKIKADDLDAAKTALAEKITLNDDFEGQWSETADDGYFTYKVLKTANIVAKIGNTKYTSFAEAVAAFKTGDTIEITGTVASDDKATVSSAVTLKIKPSSGEDSQSIQDLIKNITLGSNLTGTLNDTPENGVYTYTISAKKTSTPSGGGSSSSSSRVSTPTKTDGGSISVSSRNPAKGDAVTITAKPNDGYKVDSITVTDKNGKSVEVKDNGDGTYTFTMPDTTVSITPKFVKDETKAVDQTPAPQADTNNSSSFTDVPASQWYAEAVDFVTKNNIMNGTGNGKFSPNANLTRAMLMTMLARYDGTSTDGGSTWYEKGMQWAVSKGVSDGTKPEANITREQLVTMLYRYAGAPEVSSDSLSKFNDASGISSYARSAVAWAASNGIIDGMTDGSFAPQNSATRAQVAKIFMSYANLKDQSNQPAQDDQTANTDQTTDQTTNTDQATDQTASTDQATDQTANTDQATDQTTGTDQSAQAEQTEKTA
jgi:hypothetical protein